MIGQHQQKRPDKAIKALTSPEEISRKVEKDLDPFSGFDLLDHTFGPGTDLRVPLGFPQGLASEIVSTGADQGETRLERHKAVMIVANAHVECHVDQRAKSRGIEVSGPRQGGQEIVCGFLNVLFEQQTADFLRNGAAFAFVDQMPDTDGQVPQAVGVGIEDFTFIPKQLLFERQSSSSYWMPSTRAI